MFKISNLYWRLIATPEKYARHIGVKIGNGCLIDTRNWSSEPDLIRIDDNVQITRGVSIYTHGGQILLDGNTQILIYLERFISVVGLISVHFHK